MANKKLFAKSSSVKSRSTVSSVKVTKVTDTVNNASGIAYSLSDKSALTQLVMTGCLNNTYYVSDKDQLDAVLKLANKVEPKFLAQLAVYARENGYMKDMPATLAAVLAGKDVTLLSTIFPRVIENPKMLRNFVQIIRSGVTGRKSFGTAVKRLIQNYLENLTDEQLFKANIGTPSLNDIIKMVHPKPANKKRAALYGYLLNKKYENRYLCPLVKDFEKFKTELGSEMPDVPFQMLTALPLKESHWKKLTENMTWTQTRINLNTMARHNVFDDKNMIKHVVDTLQNPKLIEKSKVFPFQLYTAFQNIDAVVPAKIGVALQNAADLSLSNVPDFNGKVYIMVDTSGSMSNPVTGRRGTATTKTTCIDAAAVLASAILRKNPDAEIIPFDTKVHQAKFNPLDSIMTNAAKLASYGGGGTDCASALRYVNQKQVKGDLVIYISDNESYYSNQSKTDYGYAARNKTDLANEWNTFKARNKTAQLVCIDITPNTTTQMHDRSDVLNLGGFSDNIFNVIAKFVELGHNKDVWIKTIEAVNL